MRNKEKLIISAISAVLALGTSTASIADKNVATTEKCYGISKAGSNDCAAGANSCAGSATKDSQADAFLLVPTGLCDKIVGGTLKLTPESTNKKS